MLLPPPPQPMTLMFAVPTWRLSLLYPCPLAMSMCSPLPVWNAILGRVACSLETLSIAFRVRAATAQTRPLLKPFRCDTRMNQYINIFVVVCSDIEHRCYKEFLRKKFMSCYLLAAVLPSLGALCARRCTAPLRSSACTAPALLS